MNIALANGRTAQTRGTGATPSKTIWIAEYGGWLFGIRGGQPDNGGLRGCTIRYKKRGSLPGNPERVFAEQVNLSAGANRRFDEASLDKVMSAADEKLFKVAQNFGLDFLNALTIRGIEKHTEELHLEGGS